MYIERNGNSEIVHMTDAETAAYVVLFAVEPNEKDATNNVQLLANIRLYCGKFIKKAEKVS